jgi:zinc/manganese transport system permease protein
MTAFGRPVLAFGRPALAFGRPALAFGRPALAFGRPALAFGRPALAFGQPTLSWNLAWDLRQLLAYRFMVDALAAGTIVALVAAPIGWFMVLRRQTFAGHTLALVGFPGAAGAALVGISANYGYFAFCVAAALVIAAVPRGRAGSSSEESAIIGTTQAFALACGYLFVTLYAGNLNGVDSLLFGNFLGITTTQVTVLAVVAVGALVVLGAVARPLLFASVDPEVAESRGVPVRALSVLFLVLLGVAAAETSQITGSLLVFALLVLPAATAQVITARPGYSLVVALALGLGVTWIGLAVSYFSPYPIGFWITSIAFAAYLAAHVPRLAAWARPRLRFARRAEVVTR